MQAPKGSLPSDMAAATAAASAAVACTATGGRRDGNELRRGRAPAPRQTASLVTTLAHVSKCVG